jgi:MFS family permease
MPESQEGSKNYRSIAIRGTIGLAIAFAFTTFTYTAVVIIRGPLCEAMGYDAGTFSLFFSFYCAGAMACRLFLSKIIQRIGVKRTAMIGSLGPIIGLSILAFVPNIWVACIDGFITSVLLNMSSYVTYNIYVSSWFKEGQGTMMSIGSIIMNVLTIVAAPVLSSMVTTIPAQTLTFGIGVGITVIALVGTLLVAGLPSDYQCEQVAMTGKKPKKRTASTPAALGYDPAMPTGKLFLMPQVLLSFAAVIFLTLGLTAYATNTVQIYESFGLDAVSAGLCMSISSIAGVFIVAAFGATNDRVGTKKTIIAFTAIDAAMLLVSLMFTGWTSAVICAVFVYCVQYSNMYPGLVMPQVVGRKRAPQFMGYLGTATSAAGIVAPIIGMLIYNATGDFKSLVPSAALFFIITIACVVFALSPNNEEKLREADKPYLEAAEKEAVGAPAN